MYRVNEMFASLQGEGANTGRPAIFVRFAGCNLSCSFCDTDFHDFKLMSGDEIVQTAQSLATTRFVVLTGGEPTLQTDAELTDKLHAAGYTIAMETNGTRPVNCGVDWVTCSPKLAFDSKARLAITKADELKVVFDGKHAVSDFGIEAKYKFIQPCDTGQPELNAKITAEAMRFVMTNPEWRLSVQMHKLLGFK